MCPAAACAPGKGFTQASNIRAQPRLVFVQVDNSFPDSKSLSHPLTKLPAGQDDRRAAHRIEGRSSTGELQLPPHFPTLASPPFAILLPTATL